MPARRHGLTKTPTHYTWLNMKRRCLNPRTDHYDRYGGRGIRVCERWMVFDNFLADMGVKPEWATGGIDRIDNDGDYEPSNCRWVTIEVQHRDSGRWHAEKTHCPHGHPYDDDNTYYERGQRVCKECKRRRDSRRHARNRKVIPRARRLMRQAA